MTDRPEFYEYPWHAADLSPTYSTADPPATRGDTSLTTFSDEGPEFIRTRLSAQFVVRASLGGNEETPGEPREPAAAEPKVIPETEPIPSLPAGLKLPAQPNDVDALIGAPTGSNMPIVEEAPYVRRSHRNPNVEVRYLSRGAVLSINEATASFEEREAIAAKSEQMSVIEGWTPVNARPSSTTPHRGYFVDDVDNPKYIAKVTTEPQNPDDPLYPGVGLKEMDLAPKISEVVDSPAAQELAMANGFASISYAQPLAIETDHANAEETVIYPWKNGDIPEPSVDSKDSRQAIVPASDSDRTNTVCEGLKRQFEGKGLVAKGLSPQKFVVDTDEHGKQHLYLTNAEGYEYLPISADRPPEDYSEVVSNVELRTIAGQRVRINRDYEDQGLVDVIVQKVAEGTLRDGLVEVPYDEAMYRNRQYYRNAESTIFVKVTDPLSGTRGLRERSPGASVAEMQRAATVKNILASPDAQEIVRNHGFDGISYVEPLVSAVDIQTEAEVAIYPWLKGRRVPSDVGPDRSWKPAERGSERHRLEALEGALEGLFRHHGVNSHDIHIGQFLLTPTPGGRPHLNMVDAEDFQTMDIM